jgi:hypothetical protein
MTNPSLVVAVGGGGPLPTPKPMHTEPPKAGDPAGGTKAPAGGSAKKLDPKDPQWRPEPGLPSRAEDALVKEYSAGLKDLRDRRAALDRAEPNRIADPKKYDRARTALESADKRLVDLEEKALNMGGEAVNHLSPLTPLRQQIRGGNTAIGEGLAVHADALKGMPKDLRYKDFAEVEKVLNRPPNEVTAVTKTAPGDTAGGHQRLTWKFDDGSLLIADKPGPRPAGSSRPVSADRPHVEFHGPKGQRIDEQGIAVPERSIAAHITVTDQLGRMEALFAAARKGK